MADATGLDLRSRQRARRMDNLGETMSLLSIILAAAAAVLFTASALGVRATVNLVALGLAVLTIALIVQFTVYPHPIHS